MKQQGKIQLQENGNPNQGESKKTYQVTYTDGVPDEVVFPDQSYQVSEGENTPAFNSDGGSAQTNDSGEPVRVGYTFAGWQPVVAETVIESVTYEATWSKTN